MLVTGASRGIGQCIAIECARRMAAGSHIVLLARSELGLTVTKNRILEVNANVTVDTFTIDLSLPSITLFDELLTKSLSMKPKTCFDLFCIIHNAGSIGNVEKRAIELNSLDEWETYYRFNVISVVLLNNKFIEYFKDKKPIIVNITSKCGLVPFNSFCMYGSGKAAREMYFRVLAQEETDDNLIVLNYSPGPVDTDITIYVQSKSVDAGIRSYFESIRTDNTMLTPLQTSLRFIDIMTQGNYKSGDHVDYFD